MTTAPYLIQAEDRCTHVWVDGVGNELDHCARCGKSEGNEIFHSMCTVDTKCECVTKGADA